MAKRPSFLVIVADDLGFSDLGSFGGEISTPNLDALALSHHGNRLTNFHTASMCSPTRAMLMSGTDHHIAGVGQMNFWGAGADPPMPWKSRPGYEGYLNSRVAALPEILKEGGYHNILSGKWHLGLKEGFRPRDRGFDRHFSLLSAAAPHYAFEPRTADGEIVFKAWTPAYDQDGKTVTVESEDFYSSDCYGDRMIDLLDDWKDNHSDKPLFAYLPFTAPHWPLQAPKESSDKYKGFYDDGPDALRQKRLRRQVEMGLMPEDVEPYPTETDMKEWHEMDADEKKWSARAMEVYAGMVDRMDWNIGRVVDHLKKLGEFDDTFILFMSDNGAEGAIYEAIPMSGDVIKKSIGNHFNNDVGNIGNADSFVWYGARWAMAATAPSRMFKGYVTEGGIRCPAFVHYPAFSVNNSRQDKGTVSDAFVTVMDILPTILDLAKVPIPSSPFQGREVVPVKGKSWAPHLSGRDARVHEEDHVTGWELFFHQAIRKGDWKAVFIPKPDGPERWQLYDLARDQGEVHDLAEERPEVLDELIKYWMAYVSEFGVFLKDELEEGFELPPYC